jgi:hypothetical protein
MRNILHTQTERAPTAIVDSVTGRIALLWEPALAGEWFEITEPAQRVSQRRRVRSDYP